MTITKSTKNQEAIYKILTTSTGTALGDSGGAYGRHWERNQKRTIEDFMNDPAVHFTVSNHTYADEAKEFETIEHDTFTERNWTFARKDDRDNEDYSEYEYTISLFHWLDTVFDFDSTDEIAKGFNAITADTIGDEYEYIDDAQEAYLERMGYTKGDGINSCNSDSNMSQVYCIFPIYPTEDGSYDPDNHHLALVSIHNGCDIRGGYTPDFMVELSDYYPMESVYGTVTYKDGTEHEVSNSWDWYRLSLDSENGKEIEPEQIVSVSLSF